ncbi:hypothetical protein BD779DRAFT_1474694 [Infundibulicybe gibba]|nr:hypothetical protein BD779DRAFT_1474694 [Infundibulicybe gibba]
MSIGRERRRAVYQRARARPAHSPAYPPPPAPNLRAPPAMRRKSRDLEAFATKAAFCEARACWLWQSRVLHLREQFASASSRICTVGRAPARPKPSSWLGSLGSQRAAAQAHLHEYAGRSRCKGFARIPLKGLRGEFGPAAPYILAERGWRWGGGRRWAQAVQAGIFSAARMCAGGRRGLRRGLRPSVEPPKEARRQLRCQGERP